MLNVDLPRYATRATSTKVSLWTACTNCGMVVALGAAQREGAIDPVAFIERCLRNSTRSEPKQTEDGRVVYADAFGGGPVHR